MSNLIDRTYKNIYGLEIKLEKQIASKKEDVILSKSDAGFLIRALKFVRLNETFYDDNDDDNSSN